MNSQPQSKCYVFFFLKLNLDWYSLITKLKYNRDKDYKLPVDYPDLTFGPINKQYILNYRWRISKPRLRYLCAPGDLSYIVRCSVVFLFQMFHTPAPKGRQYGERSLFVTSFKTRCLTHAIEVYKVVVMLVSFLLFRCGRDWNDFVCLIGFFLLFFF